MFKLAWHAGVYLFITFIVFLICQQFIRIEERRQAERDRRRGVTGPRRVA